MVIVSQDKTKNVNFENIEACGVAEPKAPIKTFAIMANTTSDNQYILGIYETQERAQEVLQEIMQTKSDFEYYKYADESKRNELDSFMKTKYKFFDTYEMPKE